MEHTDSTIEVKQVKARKKRGRLKLALLVLVLLLVASTGIWYWQQTRLDEQVAKNRTLTDSNKQLSREKKKITQQLTAAKDEAASLDKKVVSLEKELNLLKTPEQATLMLAVASAIHNKATYNESGTDLLYIDLTVKNESGIDGFFSPYNLRLKDSSNRTHPLCEDSAIGYYVCRSGLELPAGKVELKAVSIKAGETVQGTIAFYVPKTLNTYTLDYGDQVIQINAK